MKVTSLTNSAIPSKIAEKEYAGRGELVNTKIGALRDKKYGGAAAKWRFISDMSKKIAFRYRLLDGNIVKLP